MRSYNLSTPRCIIPLKISSIWYGRTRRLNPRSPCSGSQLSSQVYFEYPFKKTFIDAFVGEEAASKLHKLRSWIAAQPPSVPAYSKTPPTEAQMHVATLITSLASIGMRLFSHSLLHLNLLIAARLFFNIAYLLNLRGSDIPFNPLFQGYLFVSLDNAVLFVDAHKVNPDIEGYLHSLGVERRDYVELWKFLRQREWGVGKVRCFSSALRTLLNGSAYTDPHHATNLICHLAHAHSFPVHGCAVHHRRDDGIQK